MKKLLAWILTVSLALTLCLGLASCDRTNPDKTPVHSHSYVEGKCECGETDPNYVAEHECIFFQGKCITCGKDDPNKHVVITGSYGVTVETAVNCEVVVDTVDVKSDEYEEVYLTLEEGNVNILDKAWVMYNVTIQPEDEAGDIKITTGKVSVPAPVPGVEEYVVYEVQQTKVEEIEYEYEDEYIVVDTWNYNYNYLVTTEEEFDIVKFYENADADTRIPDHINVGEDKAEDAYQKGQTRTLEVYACINGIKLADDDHSVMVDGYTWTEYNTLDKEVQYQQMVHIYARPNLVDANRTERFIGWYVGDFNEEGKIVLEDTPCFDDNDLEFEMPAKDLKLFAVYAHMSGLRVTGQMSKVSVNGEGFYDYLTAQISSLQKQVTLSVQPLENYRFSHWAYADDPYNPENFISDEPTFVYLIPEGQIRSIVAVCEPYAKANFDFYAICSDPQVDGDYAEYKFVINGEDCLNDYYGRTLFEYETLTVSAFPIRGCSFIGWAVVDASLNYDYYYLKENVSSTNSSFVIDGNNFNNYEGKKIIAVYEMLAHYTIQADSYFVDDQYGSFASIYLNGDARGDNFYIGRMAEGEQVTLKAVPEMNCKFAGWYTVEAVNKETHIEYAPKDLISMDAEYTFTMGTEDIVVMAKFECYPTYSVGAYAGEGGDIYINGENHYGSIRHAYEEGDKLAIGVEVKEGFEFKGWYKVDGVAEELITTDLQFEFTVGTADINFEAKLEPIVYYQVILDIKNPGITVDFDDYEGLEYIPQDQYYRFYSTHRREGDTVTIKANDVENMGVEFSHWVINGEIVGDREYTFTVGAKEITIYAYTRMKVEQIELKNASSSICKVVYSTDYETGKRCISMVSVNAGAVISPGSAANLFNSLYIVRRHIIGESRYENILAQCEIDFGGAAQDNGDGHYMFDMPGRYTVTITDKSNPELTVSFTLQIVGIDPTGTCVWVSRSGEKYHVNPFCSNMQSVTAMTVEEADAAGYGACAICCGE